MTVEDVEFALLKRSVEDLRDRTRHLQDGVEELRKQDQSRLRSAVVALGGILIGTMTYLWNVFTKGHIP